MDGPFAESKGGYLMLDVETIEEAIAIAQSSPRLAYGGSTTWPCPSTSARVNWRGEEQLVNV